MIKECFRTLANPFDDTYDEMIIEKLCDLSGLQINEFYSLHIDHIFGLDQDA